MHLYCLLCFLPSRFKLLLVQKNEKTYESARRAYQKISGTTRDHFLIIFCREFIASFYRLEMTLPTRLLKLCDVNTCIRYDNDKLGRVTEIKGDAIKIYSLVEVQGPAYSKFDYRHKLKYVMCELTPKWTTKAAVNMFLIVLDENLIGMTSLSEHAMLIIFMP